MKKGMRVMAVKKVDLSAYMNPAKQGIKDTKAYSNNRQVQARKEIADYESWKSGNKSTVKPIRGKEMNGYDKDATKVYDTNAQRSRSKSKLSRRPPVGR